MSRFTDLFWPTLEKWTPAELREMEEGQANDIASARAEAWENEPILALEEARRLAETEEDRRRTAESKASTYLLFTAALIPLLTYLETSVWDGKIGTAPKWLATAILMIAILYLMGAGIWAFRTTSVSRFHRLDVADLVRIWGAGDPVRGLVRETLVAARMNRNPINDKVSRIIMAHAFLTRAFVAFAVLLVVEAGWEIAHSAPVKIRLTIEHVETVKPSPPAAAGATAR